MNTATIDLIPKQSPTANLVWPRNLKKGFFYLKPKVVKYEI